VYATILVHILQCFEHRVHDGGNHDLIQALQATKARMAGTGATFQLLHQEKWHALTVARDTDRCIEATAQM
jgi:hypothetical protein